MAISRSEDGPAPLATRARPTEHLPTWKATWRSDLLAVAGYAAATVAFFWRVVALGMVPVGYDLLTYFYPYKAYVGQLVREGELPLWNPMIFMGAPLLANVQAAVLYPADALFLLLPAVDALRYSVVLHVFLAALFTYLFARLSLGLSPMGAWLAGAVFALGGYMGAHVGHLNQLHAAAWLPALMLCLEKAVSLRSSGIALLGGAVLAVQFLAGHTQQVYYSLWALGMLALYLAAFGGHSTRERLRPFVALGAMVAVGGSVAGIQLLPTLELMQESYRSGGIPLQEAVAYSVRPRELLDAVLPLYSQAPYVETTGYVGVVSLALLPAAVAWRSRPPWQWFFSAMAALALLLSLGDSTPVYGWLHRGVPGFDLFRAPGRWLFLYSFSLAVLVGIGADSLSVGGREDDLRRWLGRYGLALAVAVAALVSLQLWLGSHDLELSFPHPRIVLTWATYAAAGIALSLVARSNSRPGAATGLLVALVLFELYQAKAPLECSRPTDPSLYTSPTSFSRLGSEMEHSRMLSLAKERFELPDRDRLRAALPAHMSDLEVEEYLRYQRIKEAATPNVGMASGLRSLDGYDGGLLPTRRYARLKHALLGAAEHRPEATMAAQSVEVPGSRALGALGVSYLVLDREGPGHDPGWDEVALPAGSPLLLLQNRSALPRAHVVHDVRVAVDESQALEAVLGLDLSETVVLSEEVEFQKPPAAGRDEVAFVRDGAREVVLDVSLEEEGFLVLSDSYYPGWRAYVDGQEVRLLRANYAVRAVQLSPGVHRVRFAYEPLSVRLGLAVSIVGSLAVVLSLVASRRVEFFRRLP